MGCDVICESTYKIFICGSCGNRDKVHIRERKLKLNCSQCGCELKNQQTLF
jgi:Zn finger protein HypA/HybF involved in hydrogenase expression